MKVTLENTTRMVEIARGGGAPVPARVWTGKTESGIPVHFLVTRVLVPSDQPPEVHAAFASELQETPADITTPAIEAIPLRFII